MIIHGPSAVEPVQIPSADNECLGHVCQKDLQSSGARAGTVVDEGGIDNGAAMYAPEGVGRQFGFELFEWLIEQVIGPGTQGTRVFAVGLKESDLGDWQYQAFLPDADADVRAMVRCLLLVVWWLYGSLVLLKPLNGFDQPCFCVRLEQIIQCLLVKGIDGVLIVRRNKHHVGPWVEIAFLQSGSDVHAGEKRHIDVEKRNIRLVTMNGIEGFLPIVADVYHR